MVPFLVFALPRSRTRWTAEWLSAVDGRQVGHDLLAHVGSVREYLDLLTSGGVAGSVETGGTKWAGMLVRALGGRVRVGVLRRAQEDVEAELAALGVQVDLSEQTLELAELCAGEEVVLIDCNDLSSPVIAAGFQAHLLPGRAFDFEKWAEWEQKDIQIDFEARMAELAERAQIIADLKEEADGWVETARPYDRVVFEPVQVLEECLELGAAHVAEAKGDVEGPLKLDLAVCSQLAAAGRLFVQTARLNGELVGYCLWTVVQNIESAAPAAFSMGPLYVRPGVEKWGFGQQLLSEGVCAASRLGFGQVRLHHTLKGRGAKIGKLFERMGAFEFQREFVLSLKGD